MTEMKGEAYREALARVGLTPATAWPFLGLSRRQSFRIADGSYAAPRSAALLLALMAERGIMAKDVEE